MSFVKKSRIRGGAMRMKPAVLKLSYSEFRERPEDWGLGETGSAGAVIIREFIGEYWENDIFMGNLYKTTGENREERSKIFAFLKAAKRAGLKVGDMIKFENGRLEYKITSLSGHGKKRLLCKNKLDRYGLLRNIL